MFGDRASPLDRRRGLTGESAHKASQDHSREKSTRLIDTKRHAHGTSRVGIDKYGQGGHFSSRFSCSSTIIHSSTLAQRATSPIPICNGNEEKIEKAATTSARDI